MASTVVSTSCRPMTFEPNCEFSNSEPSSPQDALLDAKILVHIFIHLSIRDLMTVGLVTKKWRLAHLKVCATKTRLNLIQCPQYYAQLEDISQYWYFANYQNEVKFEDTCFRVERPLTRTGVNWLGSRFAGVTKLAVYCVEYLRVDTFVLLIKKWPKLTSLVLFGANEDQKMEYDCGVFWKGVTSLRSLLHLRLPFQVYDSLPKCMERLPLERLYFTFVNSLYNLDLEPNFHLRPGCSKVMKTLAQTRPTETVTYSQWMDSNCRQFANYIRDVRRLSDSKVMFNSVFRNAIELDYELAEGTGSLGAVMRNWSTFPRLYKLRITPHPLENHTQMYQLFDPICTKQDYRDKFPKTFRTVRILYLHKFNLNPTEKHDLLAYFSAIFPNVILLHLEQCHYSGLSISLLVNLKRFPRLTRIWCNYRLMLIMNRMQDRFGNVEILKQVDRIRDELTESNQVQLGAAKQNQTESIEIQIDAEQNPKTESTESQLDAEKNPKTESTESQLDVEKNPKTESTESQLDAEKNPKTESTESQLDVEKNPKTESNESQLDAEQSQTESNESQLDAEQNPKTESKESQLDAEQNPTESMTSTLNNITL